MYFWLLKSVLWLISAANEVALPFNPWLFSSASDLENDWRDWFPSTPMCASIYAISEPLWTFGLLLIPLTPLILVLGTGIAHLTVSRLLIQTSMLVKNERQHRLSQSKDTAEKRRNYDELRSRSDNEQSEGTYLLKATAVALIQSTAASNASLLLFAQDLNAAGSTNVHNKVYNGLSFFALLFFICSRMADFEVSKRTTRAVRIVGQGHKDAATQLKKLGWLVLARAITRRCFGMAMLGLLELQDAELMAARYTAERHQLIQSKVKTLPKWLPFALLPLSFGMMALSHWHWRRAQARASSSAEPVANQASR